MVKWFPYVTYHWRRRCLWTGFNQELGRATRCTSTASYFHRQGKKTANVPQRVCNTHVQHYRYRNDYDILRMMRDA